MSFKLLCALVLLSASCVNAMQIQADCNFRTKTVYSEGKFPKATTTRVLNCSITRFDNNNQKWSLSSRGLRDGYAFGCDSNDWFCFEMDPNQPNWTSGYACNKKVTVWDNNMQTKSCGDDCTTIYNKVVYNIDC
ncbi:hypothetical protein BKA57DRAFT_490753 [Linnemannia elongata]|nr:hypothetical protein BKA57DRAFT_490752 [Linnemannia elongata]KAH7052477.1 hypothetical protein BKA57DRAFT_490753 [Linnemannia elongata]